MTRPRALLGATLAAGLAATGPCGADAGATVIPEGARVAGLEVGGLAPSAAAERIEAAFGDRLRERIQVTSVPRGVVERRRRLETSASLI